MKTPLAALIASLALVSFDANAWFFFWLPIPGGGSATSDNTCVAETVKEGDTMNSPNGNIAKITKLSGTSSRCSNGNMPILATVDYTSSISFSSKAGIELPEKYKPIGLTDRQKFFEGILLKAKTDDGKLYIQINAYNRSVMSSVPEFVKKQKDNLKNLDDSTTSEIEELTIDGFPVRRYEQKGKLKNFFGSRMVMLHTIVEAKDEVIHIAAWGYENDYPDEKATFLKLPSAIKGLTPPIAKAVETPPIAKVSEASAKDAPPPAPTNQVETPVKKPSGPAKSDALIAAQEAVADNPDKTASWIKLGSVHFEEKNYDKASVAYEEALKRNPKAADAFEGLGDVYNAQGEKDKVREVYFKLKKLDAAKAAAYYKKFLLP